MTVDLCMDTIWYMIMLVSMTLNLTSTLKTFIRLVLVFFLRWTVWSFIYCLLWKHQLPILNSSIKMERMCVISYGLLEMTPTDSFKVHLLGKNVRYQLWFAWNDPNRLVQGPSSWFIRNTEPESVFNFRSNTLRPLNRRPSPSRFTADSHTYRKCVQIQDLWERDFLHSKRTPTTLPQVLT